MIRLRAVPPTLTVAAALACAAIGCNSAPEPLTCANPLPVSGEYDPKAPGYVVSFRDGVDTRREAARLADHYGFTVTSVRLPTQGFAADFEDDVREQLRCEPSILYLVHNSSIVID